MQFPLTRLIVMGAVCVLLIGLSNGFREALSSHPWLALAAAAGMASLGLAIYFGFIPLIKRLEGVMQHFLINPPSYDALVLCHPSDPRLWREGL